MDNLEFVQLIDEQGGVVGKRSRLDAIVDEIAPLYAAMVLTRELDEEFVNLQRQGQLALYPSCRGQEAAQVGSAAATRATDWLFPAYRELGVFVVRGVAIDGIGSAWRGVWHSGHGFLEKCVAPMSIPIATQALHAVGSAMASRWLRDEGVTVAYFGDGATSEGDVHEALNLAAVEQAPCVFFVQNNQWAVSTPLREQTHARAIADKGLGYGMSSVRIDGNDVAATYTVTRDALERARTGNGPTLIEAITYRLGPHTTADDPTRYRDEAEVAYWRGRDPLTRCRKFLENEARWSLEDETALNDRARAARAELRAAVIDMVDASPLELFDSVFETPTPALLAQRAEMAAELEEERR